MALELQHNPFKTPKEIERPLLYWVHKNLFSSVLNTVLTLLSLTILYLLVSRAIIPLFSWDWTVISANLKLILTGSYPMDQMWRVWFCLWYASLFFGLTFSMNRTRPPKVMYLILISILFLSLLGFSLFNRVSMLVTAFLLFASFFVGTRLGQQKKAISAALGWIVLLPLSFFIIRGGGRLPSSGQDKPLGRAPALPADQPHQHIPLTSHRADAGPRAQKQDEGGKEHLHIPYRDHQGCPTDHHPLHRLPHPPHGPPQRVVSLCLHQGPDRCGDVPQCLYG